ncbi:MAG: type II toxin-antitoxin system RelE/ParE family toxin [Pseudomonadales bacterium]|nr:type II toxin-antitoxin system RelE/ParE family toxin [Pseudomonadales bacterium]
MTYSLTLRREAELDLGEQFEYYEEIREGLGHDFLLCVEEALDKIARNPLIYKDVYKGLRRIPIRRFPHRIFYMLNSNKIIVTAVFHVRKDPNSWGGRT